MTTFNISTNAFIEGQHESRARKIEGLYSGSAIDKMAACRLSSDGFVYPANATVKTSGSASDFIGFAPRKITGANQPVTLYGAGAILGYSDAELTPGKLLFVSGSSNPGKLSDAPIFSGDAPVAIALTSSTIAVIR